MKEEQQKEVLIKINEVRVELQQVSIKKSAYNKHLKYYYPNRDDVREAINPLMSKSKLIDQIIEVDIIDNIYHFIVRYTDLDSGAYVDYKYTSHPDKLGGIQQFGSTTTYMDRYQLGMVFGICYELDPDLHNGDKKTQKEQNKPSLPQLPEGFDNFKQDLANVEQGDLITFNVIRNSLGGDIMMFKEMQNVANSLGFEYNKTTKLFENIDTGGA